MQKGDVFNNCNFITKSPLTITVSAEEGLRVEEVQAINLDRLLGSMISLPSSPTTAVGHPPRHPGLSDTNQIYSPPDYRAFVVFQKELCRTVPESYTHYSKLQIHNTFNVTNPQLLLINNS